MAIEVYQKLAQHLDDLPPGFPTSKSGVEMRILRRLFTPEDAELALHLSLIAEEPRVIARRANIPIEEAARRLEEMEKKGLIYAIHKKGQTTQYMAAPYVVGIYEFQLNRLGPEIVQDFEEYGPTWFDPGLWQKAPQIRTVPVGESISAQAEVMSYERAEELVRAHTKFAVAPCICRQERSVAGEECNKPLETCLSFGTASEFYVHNGLGRKISQDEALLVLELAEEVGLVLQPDNGKKARFICACCGCCCGILRSVKRYPRPASIVSSPFMAALDVDTCDGCGTCETRCQMEAIYVDNGTATLDLDRCIGCGLCVTECPSEALSLVRKPEAEQTYVPRNYAEANLMLGRARGKMGAGELVRMAVRSKVDRLLAPK